MCYVHFCQYPPSYGRRNKSIQDRRSWYFLQRLGKYKGSLSLTTVSSYTLCKRPWRFHLFRFGNVKTFVGDRSHLILKTKILMLSIGRNGKDGIGRMVEKSYLVYTSRISIVQYFHAVLDDLQGFFFCQCIFPSFNWFTKERLGDVCTITGCECWGRVCRSQQIYKRQKPWWTPKK